MAGADVEMAANATTPAVNAEMLRQMLRQMQWEILMEFNDSMWWMMPHELSGPIVENWRDGCQQSSYVWPWHGTRQRSYQPRGAPSDISRYVIDFTTMQQRNIDNGRTRNIRIVYVFR